MIRVTADTDVIVEHKRGRIDLAKLSLLHSLDIAAVSVSERELRYKIEKIINLRVLSETTVWNETPWGMGKWGAHSDDEIFEKILSIISNGGFPKSGHRSCLSKGQTHMVRDAMILAAHIREKRDIFLSNDRRAFVGKGNDDKRCNLEKVFGIRVMTLKEFIEHFPQKGQ